MLGTSSRRTVYPPTHRTLHSEIVENCIEFVVQVSIQTKSKNMPPYTGENYVGIGLI